MGKLEPGPELDAAVAERVMGVKHVAMTPNGVVSTDFSLPYSTSMEYAWQVVERLKEKSEWMHIALYPMRDGKRWGCDLCLPHHGQVGVVGVGAPHAICLAAMAAKEASD